MTLSRKEKEILEDLPFRADDAWYTLLVHLGLKSGAWVDLHSNIWREGETTKNIPDTTIKEVQDALDYLGLKYHMEKRVTDAGLRQPDDDSRKRMHTILDIYITKDQKTLDKILLARKNNDHKLLGRSLGYPETAVNAFGSDSGTLASDLDPKIQLSEAGQLTYFALSKDHWKDELKVVEEWIAAIKRTSDIMWRELRSFADLVDNELVELIIKSRE